MLHLLFVSHNELVVFLHILVAALTHLFLRESRLMAEAFIHLGLKDAELIKFGLFSVTQPAITGGTMLESEPEVRVFLDHLGIIADGSRLSGSSFNTKSKSSIPRLSSPTWARSSPRL